MDKERKISFNSNIWDIKGISHLERLILIEIDALDKDRHCFAKNEHFANIFEVSIRQVSGSISNLIKLGYIEHVVFNGNKRILQVTMKKTSSLPSEKLLGNIEENFYVDRKKTSMQDEMEGRRKLPAYHEENFQLTMKKTSSSYIDMNIPINLTVNNTIEKKDKEKKISNWEAENSNSLEFLASSVSSILEHTVTEDSLVKKETSHLKQQNHLGSNTVKIALKLTNIVENKDEIGGNQDRLNYSATNNTFLAQNTPQYVEITNQNRSQNAAPKQPKLRSVKVETVLPYPQNWTEAELEAWQRWINKPRKKLKQINSDRAKRHIVILESVRQQEGDIVYAIDVVADTWEGMQEHFFDNYLSSIRRKQTNAHSPPKTYYATTHIPEMERRGLLDPFTGYKPPKNNLED